MRGVRAPLRAIPLLATLSFVLVAAASAQGITVTASMDGGSPNVTWTQPEGYPELAYVDAIEVATAPDVDEFGYFLIDNVVGLEYYSDPADSTGRWRGTLTLQPGVTYYVHVEVYEVGQPTGVWSPAVPFTVPAATGPSPESGTQTPSESGAPAFPIVPIAGEQEPVAGPDYQARARRRGSTLVLSFRDRAQVDETPPAPYKVCWTRPVGIGCARRVVFDGAWDVVRLRVTQSVGRPQAEKRVVRITWRVGGHTVRQATLSVQPAQANAARSASRGTPASA